VKTPHVSVLQNEVVEVFNNVNGLIVDCTVGFGGHSELILKNNPNIKLLCVDRDSEALEFSKKRLSEYQNRVEFLKSNFGNALDNITNFNGLLADIGVSSYQLDTLNRGFSFNSETLDMRMDRELDLSAYEVVNFYNRDDLELIFRDYGEIREYKKLANIIINYRKDKKIESGRELAELIERHFAKSKIHPATLAFQAIRIEVNGELKELENLLNSIEKISPKSAIIAIISFHSLEDRIIKNRFRDWSKSCICDETLFKCECGNNHSKGEIITKKPITPSEKEIKLNPRSRSSKMRVFKFGN